MSNTPNTDSTLRPPDEFKGKTFRECAEIIVGNPKDEDWTDHQINQLCKQHEQLIALKVQEAVNESKIDMLKTFQQYEQNQPGYIDWDFLESQLSALHKIKGEIE